MNKQFLGVVAMVFSFIFVQTAYADCGEGMKKVIQSLKLDEAQKNKIKPALEQLKTSLKDNGSQMRDLHMQINQQVMSENMDQSTVDGLVNKQATLIGNIMKAKANSKHQIFTALTPQQRTKYQDAVKKFEEKIAAKYEKCLDND